ncbi:TonB-dependent receptor [Sphingomonas sp. ASV193]|uniref:TonB-dependent receptor n=1 Tax=Sphingomonas sp. ASV193 TaxID=3144405 RepID=UPI0032E8BCBA
MASHHMFARNFLVGASLPALSVALLVTPVAAHAQVASGNSTSQSSATNPNKTSNDEIVVTGTRKALRTSRDIKRKADTVVDSITATDIGAFPDKSVAEALQRVPGITVNRFAATSDTAHFSAEPSGVIVRGLPQVRSEFNGRDTFSANSNRGLSWTDVTPELMAGVDVYKNQTAELIEGGIAGSINLRTRVPFDATGQLVQVGVKANYGDLSKKWTPDINGFYSNRWMTGIGEIGIMGNIAYSDVKTASQGIQYARAGIYDNGSFPGSTGTVYVPSGIEFRSNEYDRKRTGIAAAAQWRSLDRKILATLQYNRSLNNQEWQERAVGAGWADLYGNDVRWRFPASGRTNTIPVAAPGSNFVFDSNGNFQSGTFNQGHDVNWWGAPPGDVGYGVNSSGQPMFTPCYTWMSADQCPNPSYGSPFNTASRYNKNRNMTQDVAFNLKWEATDRLRFNFDGQYVDSKIDNYDIEVDFNSFSDVFLDASGPLPRVKFLPPTNVNQSAGGLSNPNSYYIRSVMDHLEQSKGNEKAFRADGEYDIKSGILDSLKFGARYADREQKVQWSTYNWRNVANTWTDYSPCPHPFFNLDSKPTTACGVDFKGYPQGFYETAPFGSNFLGGNLGTFPFVPFDFLRNHGADGFSVDRTGVGQFVPVCERNGQIPGVTPVENPDSCFTSDEIADISEKTKAAYAMLRFGGNDSRLFGIPFAGNVGVRYVDTRLKSYGSARYPVISGLDATKCPPVALTPGGLTGTATDPGAPPDGAPPIVKYPAYCYLSPQDLAFASGNGGNNTARASNHQWLPSFNIRFDLSPSWLVRFAASRAMSRPDIGLLKNYFQVNAQLPGADLSDPRYTIGADGQPTAVTPTYTADAYNPYLKPITAWQFDVSLEHYFGQAGLFSIALFHKTFQNYIQYGVFDTVLTNNGVTRTVRTRGPANGKGAKIDGMEVAYNRFFDFLPKPLDGLGVQANFTYVKNKGVPNSGLSPVGGTGGAITNAGNAGSALDPGTLEGLSKYTFNLVGLYEKGKVSARVAYNWRSKYLVTAVDCCVYLPVWQKGTGYLDASLRYRVTDNLELSAEGSNLLNTKTVLYQQVTDEMSPEGKRILTPNGWFINDRRFIVGARIRFGK